MRPGRQTHAGQRVCRLRLPCTRRARQQTPSADHHQEKRKRGYENTAKGPLQARDCEACHGPRGQHVAAPDNRYQNASLSLGFDLPMASRLAATLSYGMMDQDETLLPYSSSSFDSATAFNSTNILPRSNADAEINTTMFNADYSINPIDRLNLRAFVRYYDLNNKTPQSDWWYVTDDTISTANATSGETTELNKRVNLAYSYDQTNYGLETSYSLPFWRTTLGLGYEREDIDREFREANTEGNKFKGSVKTRPTDWLTLRAKYLYGDRDGGTYNNTVTAQSYWDVPTAVGTTAFNENPANSFSNHPDMLGRATRSSPASSAWPRTTPIPRVPNNTLAETYQFAFRNPETVTHRQYNLNATLEYQFLKNLVAGVHYIYDRYKISGWMQEANTPWYESVGGEYLLRDTSDATSNQWGNRLINLGSYLGPSYEAHFGAVTLTYRF